jgi:hypothetical protein
MVVSGHAMQMNDTCSRQVLLHEASRITAYKPQVAYVDAEAHGQTLKDGQVVLRLIVLQILNAQAAQVTHVPAHLLNDAKGIVPPASSGSRGRFALYRSPVEMGNIA